MSCLRPIKSWCLPSFALFLLVACEQVDAPSASTWPPVSVPKAITENLTRTCVDDHVDGFDYFPQKSGFRHSAQLSISYHNNYKLLRFNATVGDGEPIYFALVQCGTSYPENLPDNTQIIEVPIRRLATANEAIYGALAEINAVDVLVGVPNIRSITVPEVKARAAAGNIVEMYGWGHSSIEPILALNPDVYLTFYSAYPEFQMHPTLWQLGVKALPQADHLEPTPLGRAEWIKFLALLVNQEAQANRVFASIESQYLALQGLVKNVEHRPTVITGYASKKDTWDTQGGRNFRTQLIKDAGGKFAMENELPTANGWLMLPFEKVYAANSASSIWFGGLQGISSFDQLIESNALYSWLPAVRQKNVFPLDKGYQGYWAFPYVDQAMTKPHWALEDAIRIFHPELFSPADLLPHAEFHFVRILK